MFCGKHRSKMFLFLILSTILGLNALYENSEYVTELDAEKMEADVEAKNDMWILQFYMPGDAKCKEFTDTYNKAAQAFHGFAKFGSINVESEILLAYKYDVIEVPSIFALNPIGETSKLSQGDLVEQTIDAITHEIHERLRKRLVPTREVKELNAGELEHVQNSPHYWMVASYNSTSENTRNLSDVWEYVSSKLKSVIKFGACDSKPQGNQSIIFYDRKPYEYEGDLNGDEIVDWALTKLKTPKILFIRDEDSVRKACVKNDFCVLTILPNTDFCDQACQNKYKSVLKEIAAGYKQYSWGWLVMNAGLMQDVDIILDVSFDSQDVVVIMVHVKTFKYERLSKPFSKEHVEEMLQNAVNGTGFARVLPIFENLSKKAFKKWIHDEL